MKNSWPFTVESISDGKPKRKNRSVYLGDKMFYVIIKGLGSGDIDLPVGTKVKLTIEIEKED